MFSLNALVFAGPGRKTFERLIWNERGGQT